MFSGTPVFDFAASAPWAHLHAAFGGADAVDAEIARRLDAGESPGAVWERLWDAEVRRFETDRAVRERVRDVYEAAGVDLFAPTLWSFDPAVPEPVGLRRDLARWQARADAADWLHRVTAPAHARDVVAEGDVGALLNTQNAGVAIDGRLREVDTLYDGGVRSFQLTYNYQNDLGTGCNDPSRGGLSSFGREVVDRLTDLGAIVDLSHCGERTTLDTIEYADAPVAVTHASCRSVVDHFRGKSDAELEALAAADGYIGIPLLPYFLDPSAESPDLDLFRDHLDHAVSVVGVDRVGVGSDFFPADVQFPDRLLRFYKDRAIAAGFEREAVENRVMAAGIGQMRTYTDWPVLRDVLEATYTEDEVAGILGANFLDFWARAC